MLSTAADSLLINCIIQYSDFPRSTAITSTFGFAVKYLRNWSCESRCRQSKIWTGLPSILWLKPFISAIWCWGTIAARVSWEFQIFHCPTAALYFFGSSQYIPKLLKIQYKLCQTSSGSCKGCWLIGFERVSEGGVTAIIYFRLDVLIETLVQP